MLMVYFNHPNICWRVITAGYKQFRRCLTQVVEKPAKRGAMMDFIKQRRAGCGMKVKGSLGYSVHEIMEFRIRGAGQKARSQHWTSGEKTLTSLKICLI